jgi:hypothetical protein
MGGGVGRPPACRPQWLYADHQLHGGDRCPPSPGDDDGPDPVRCRPAGDRQYQILISLLIGGATGLGVPAATFASVWGLTDGRERLRLGRLGCATEIGGI